MVTLGDINKPLEPVYRTQCRYCVYISLSNASQQAAESDVHEHEMRAHPASDQHCLVCGWVAGNARVLWDHIARNHTEKADEDDPVNHPTHYTSSRGGAECIDVVEHMSFNRGNAIKYLWRAGLKGDELEDLKKARWYVDREIKRLEAL